MRALSNLTVGLKVYQGIAKYKYLAGNAFGEMHRSNRVPIIYETAKAIYEHYGGKGIIMDTESQYKLDQYYTTELESPGMAEREAYFVAYGISPQDQLAIEQELRDNIQPAKWLNHFDLPLAASEVYEN